MKARKYDYLKVLQGYYPETGWEDLEAADEYKPEEVKELRSDMKSYRENDPRPYRKERGTMESECVIDMWYGEKYDSKKHCVPGIHWSDVRRIYWGWIHAGEKGEIVGDFTAESAQDAEKALGVKFVYD